ncbi:MAG TPA: hypothetical protein VGI78_03280 [Acetobacteraceae bacterium]|jgi:hypothetical protein
MTVQPNQDDDDLELLALADATDRVAEAVNDAVIRARLRAIADEIRAMARHGGCSFDDLQMLEA